jgi:hypothetical protein
MILGNGLAGKPRHACGEVLSRATIRRRYYGAGSFDSKERAGSIVNPIGRAAVIDRFRPVRLIHSCG